MYRLHYAHLELEGDIPVFEFEKIDSMIEFIKKNETGKKRQVYLFTTHPCEDNEIIVSEYISFITSCIDSEDLASPQDGVFGYPLNADFHLQAYESYESAYAVALDMKEGNPLCYDND